MALFIDVVNTRNLVVIRCGNPKSGFRIAVRRTAHKRYPDWVSADGSGSCQKEASTSRPFGRSLPLRLLAGIAVIGAAGVGSLPAQANPDPTDVDGDGFAATVELYVGTNPLLACGTDAWPPDLDNDSVVDTRDISRLTNFFAKQVEPDGPAPVRYDIVPDGAIDTADIARMTGYFGDHCA